MVTLIGQHYGPGNVTANNLPAGCSEVAALLTPQPATLDSASPATQGLDIDTVRFIITGLVSGVPQIQRHIIDNYTMPDIEFVHTVGSTRGRENYYHVYRSATTTLDYQVVIRDIFLTPTKACAWVDLKVRARLPFFPTPRRTLPCMVLLYFATDPADGKVKVALQHDHHTLYAFNWLGGMWAQQVSEAITRPLQGWGLITTGKLFETASKYMQRLYDHFGWQPHGTGPQAGGAALPSPAAAYVYDMGLGDKLAAIQQHTSGTAARSEQASVDALFRQATKELGRQYVLQEQDRSEWDRFGAVGKVAQVAVGLWGLIVGLLLAGVLASVALLFPVPLLP